MLVKVFTNDIGDEVIHFKNGDFMVPIKFIGLKGIAQEFNVTRDAVVKWRLRYPNTFPEPDVEIDGVPGWDWARLDAIRIWRKNRPGQGRRAK